MDHASHNHQGQGFSYSCSGDAWEPTKASTWSEAFLTGFVLLLWGLHWAVGVSRRYLHSSNKTPYQATATFDLPFLPSHWPVESSLKLVVSLLGILTTLWWAEGHWKSLSCSPSSKLGGEDPYFNPSHIYGWQNAWVLFAFMLSGIVDLLAPLVDLPHGTDQAMLATAFSLYSLQLSFESHTDALELMLYKLLRYSAMATTTFLWIEVMRPESFWAGAGKAYGAMLQGIWMFAIARFVYEDHIAWRTTTDEGKADMAPAQYLPVVFVFWLTAVAVLLLLVFLAVKFAYKASSSDQGPARSGHPVIQLGTRAPTDVERRPLLSKSIQA